MSVPVSPRQTTSLIDLVIGTVYLREKLLLQRGHVYGRSPVSWGSQHGTQRNTGNVDVVQQSSMSIRWTRRGRTRPLMTFQMLCFRKPPFAIPTFLREEASVPVLHWTGRSGRHHLRTVSLWCSCGASWSGNTTLNNLAARVRCPCHDGRMQRNAARQ